MSSNPLNRTLRALAVESGKCRSEERLATGTGFFGVRFCRLWVAGALFFAGIDQGLAQNSDPAVESALRRAAQFLVSQQDQATGSISLPNRSETAVTSLSILALGALGHQPGDPTPEGGAMRKALDSVLARDVQQPDGYFGQKDYSRMYGHGITTLMLAEMLGMGADADQDRRIREQCRKAVSLIERAQRVAKIEHQRGGWRYTPEDASSDLSVTVWQVMALRAAKNAGVDVAQESVENAVDYIKRLYQEGPVLEGGVKSGGFGYQNKGIEISTTAEGLLALQVSGQYQAPETLAAAERLFAEGLKPGERWFFYTAYYYAQGMCQRGGKYAEEARRTVAEVLLPIQQQDGSWEQGGGDGREAGKVYATCMAILSLAVKNHFLPIYQR